MRPTEPTSASSVLLIRPASFAANPETAASNSFQAAEPEAARQLVSRAALEEFGAFAETLAGAGIDAIIADDTPTPPKPDAVFPNNWFSTHADGTVVLYPMMAPSRRLERRPEILEALGRNRGFRVQRVIDLSPFESQGRFLEGTGSLVLDRPNRIAYACLSPRTDRAVLSEFGSRLEYEVIAFRAFDHKGTAIYHTNVMLSLGTEFAVVCSACIEESGRARVLRSLRATRASIIEVSQPQMELFACNILEVRTRAGERAVLMSETAARALRLMDVPPPGVDLVITAAIPTIERYGGGSLRCMLAEIFLPQGAGMR
jgi:hypothetical protein